MYTGILTCLVLFSVCKSLFHVTQCDFDTGGYIIKPHYNSSVPKLRKFIVGRLVSKIKQQNSVNMEKVTSSYLFVLVLTLSADVESNPGPEYPCGTCGLEVKENDAAILCDTCNIWFHIHCEGFSQAQYSELVSSNQSFSWLCTNCDSTNFSTVSNSSLSSHESNNSFSPLSDPIVPQVTSISVNPDVSKKKSAKNFFSSLKVMTINFQSIVNKKLEFHALLESDKPDIVFGTESWLTSKHTDSEIFPQSLGYTPYRHDRNTGKSGGGVFILVKNSILVSEMKRLQTNCELIWLKLELFGTQPLYLGSYYRPHEQDENSILELRKSLDMVTKLKGKVWLTGDFNFPKLAWDSEGIPTVKPGCSLPKLYEEFISLVNDFSLQQMVTFPTRLNNTLDLFFTSNPSLIKSVKSVAGISDHDIVHITSDVKPRLNKQKPRTVHLFRKANWVNFQEYIDSRSPSMFNDYHSKSIEELWTEFKNLIHEGINLFIPSKRLGSKPSLPWITQSIKRQIRKRDKLYVKMKKGSCPKVKQHYKNLRNKVKHEIKQAHTNYLEYVLEIQSGDPENPQTGQNFSRKKLFSTIKNAKQDTQGIAPLLENDKLITDSRGQANVLNRQFQSVFTPMNPLKLGQLCSMKTKHLFSTTKLPQYPKMPDISISVGGVQKLLSTLQIGKACGPDDLKPIVLKNLSVQIAPLVTKLFQKSLDTGTIPSDWTKANVTPLFKKGDKSNPANYRPISLTCVLCKLMEHIVASNITKHFQVNNILYHLQHGFRSKRSCETQLIGLVEDLSRNLIQGHQTDLILLDFSKAFDKVNHLKLLYKLHQHGIQNNTLQWVKSFLIGRRQSVLVNGEKSDEVPVTSGVPQGSVLGPLLFLLYINDLPENIISQVRLFADDTAIYITVNNNRDQTLQEDLNRLQKWEHTWDMEFNPSKCTVINITRSKHPHKTSYTLHGQTLATVSDAKYLGVCITSDLSWNKHINQVTTTASQTLNFIKRNIPTKHHIIRQFAYKTLVRPQLEYCSSVWSPHTQQNIHKIEMVQRRAARWVTSDNSHYSSVTSMLEKLGWRSLGNRRCDSRLLMFYKIVHGLVAVPMPQYVLPTTRLTRHMHPLSFRQIQTPCNYYKCSFYPATIVLWNSLPANVAQAPTLDQFRQGVTKLCHNF